MAKDYFSSEVCEQLACDLVTEQAELLKHQALVNRLKERLVEGKSQLIRKLILGKSFMISGKKRTVLNLEFEETDGILKVWATIGLDPDEIKLPANMTRRETELFWCYKDYFQICYDDLDGQAGQEFLSLADKIHALKNHIHLKYTTEWLIDFSNATTPGFFGQSGLEIHTKDGYYMLEDLIVY